MNFDPAVADVAIVKAIASLVVVIISLLGLWHRFYRTRRNVSFEKGEQGRYEDALQQASEARREAHDANNAVMAVQRQLGRLEAENEECNRRADRQDIEIAQLKTQNGEQAEQINLLSRALKARFKPTDTDPG